MLARLTRTALIGLVASLSLALSAAAAEKPANPSGETPANPGAWVDAIHPIPTPPQPAGIALPGGDSSTPMEAWATGTAERLLYNVGQPQLVPLPGGPAGVAPAVLLVPGGGFQFLSMDNEGYQVAERLRRLGVRVFIVKYRTLPVPAGFPDFKEAIAATFQRGVTPDLNQRVPAAADIAAAIRLVRARAGEWRVDPKKITVVGFSAGAIALVTELLAHPDARPDFVGLIYGPTAGVPVPPNPAPLFAAQAADDRFFKGQDLSLIHAWRQAGAPVELHLYSGGGHGFASHIQGTTSDAWFDQFALWLKVMGASRP